MCMRSLCSEDLLILEAVIGASMITVMVNRGLASCQHAHVRGVFVTLVYVLFIIRPYSSFSPFLGSGCFAVETLVPLVHPVDYIIVVILPKQMDIQIFNTVFACACNYFTVRNY